MTDRQNKKIHIWKIQPDYTLIKIDFPFTVTNLDQVSLNLPAGAYTTFRTYDRIKALCLDQHFSRLEESADLVGLTIKIDRVEIRRLLKRVIDLAGFKEMRIRITVDTTQSSGTIYLAIEELALLPKTVYEKGVSVMTTKLFRKNPKAKLTDFISASTDQRNHTGKDINEILMVDDEGYILEGLTSNFFAFIKERLWTAEKGVLYGVTRELVIEIAKNRGIDVVLNACKFSDIPNFNEAFITSTSRGILPVVKVNEIPVGDGCPGKMTTMLMEDYNRRIALEIAPI